MKYELVAVLSVNEVILKGNERIWVYDCTKKREEVLEKISGDFKATIYPIKSGKVVQIVSRTRWEFYVILKGKRCLQRLECRNLNEIKHPVEQGD